MISNKVAKQHAPNEEGFSVVEAVITLFVGTTLLLAMYQLFSATTQLSQDSLERAYAYNMAMRYIDQARYLPAEQNHNFDSNDYAAPYIYQPEARGSFRLLTTSTAQSATLEMKTVTVEYGPQSNRRSVTLNAFIRNTGGQYF